MALVAFSESCRLNIKGIKRIWCKAQLELRGQLDPALRQAEWQQDLAIMDMIGVGLEEWMQQVFHCQTFIEFEDWIDKKLVNKPVNNKIKVCFQSNLLTQQQHKFFAEYGYLVIPSVITKLQAQQTCDFIWHFLGKEPTNPETWTHPHPAWQKTMVQLFDHPLLTKNRNSEKIQQLYQELWQTTELVTSTDRVGFNPPETPRLGYQGIGLHWDLDLSSPIKFGLQGLLYLTDTAENQGAFTCVPGFQHKIDDWLAELPEGANPQLQDLAVLGAKPIAACAGDFIVWHQALPHGTSPNTANTARIVQYINMYPVT